MMSTLEVHYYYFDMMEELSWHKLNWCISIWGEGFRDTRALIKRTIQPGGHVKTGLELFFDPVRNQISLELPQEAKAIAKEVGRPLATQQEAREIYGIAQRSVRGYRPA